MTYSEANLSSDVIVPINLFRADLPGFTLRAWTGVGDLTALSQTFEGTGDLLSINALEGSTNQLSPRLVATLTGVDATLTSELVEYAAQGSRIYLWYGLLNSETGALVADPQLIFDGRIDTATVQSGQQASIEVECIGGLEYAARRSQRKRTSGDQESIWAGDLFFEFAGQDGSLPWGNENAGNRGAASGGGGGFSTRPGSGGGQNSRLV